MAMRMLNCGVLMACMLSATAYRHKDVAYNLFPLEVKRYDNLIGGTEVAIPCPVCPGDECEKTNGQFFKVCRYGTHSNPGCNSRLDCLRGPGEPCNDDHYVCQGSLSCRRNLCTGVSWQGHFEESNYASKDNYIK